MDLDKAIDSRHSVREFKETKKADYKKVIEALDAAARGPLAGNLPALKFIMVSNKQKIKDLSIAAQQDFILRASFVVVVCSDKKFLEKYYYERADRYAKHQAGAAIENLLLKITDLGLASCWIGAFSDQAVKRILNIPENIDVEAMLPIGYSAEENVKKIPKPDINGMLFFDKYKEKHMVPISDVPASKT